MNEALYNARKTKGWTQEKTAKKANINRCLYLKIEKGQTPSLVTAYKIAMALGERVDNIFLPLHVLK